MRRRALLATACLLAAALLALSYQGALQRGLDLWTVGRAAEAQAEFRRWETGGTLALARLNRLIAEGEQALDADDATGRRTLLRVSNDLATLASTSPQKTLALHHAGRLALAGGDRAKGLKLLETAYRQQPRNQALANALLEALLAGANNQKLREIAQHQADLRPDNPFCWYALGEAERRSGLRGRALTNWSRGIGVFPLRPMLMAGIPLAHAQGRDDLARAWLETLRFRYGDATGNRGLAAWCDSLKLKALYAALPADQEAKRYADRFPDFFPIGREWTYKVRYGIIPLGLLKVGVRQREDVARAGARERGEARQEAFRVYYKIDSNPAYRMIIDLHDSYEALIPSHCLESAEFVLKSRSGDNRADRIYSFDFERQLFTARGYHDEGDIFRQQLPLARQVFDGLSLLFAARRQVREGRYGTVLTIVDEEVHKTVIRYSGRDQAKIMGRSRKVVEIHGQADYQGIAGLTGEFWGQFSDDREALPLAARFQIKLGKISIELDEVGDGAH